ncbi:hypothetical protein DFH09DRAFT_1214723 [Mycena vulgaris]|nr:hypothetical protein DFH09DRAFT_1214723 [Mycena vulgaris]
MPSTTRGDPGEVDSPITAPLPSHDNILHPLSPPPFRKRPILTHPTPPNKNLLRLLVVGPVRRRPPYSSHATCARFRLAKKTPPRRQFDIATVTSAAVERLDAYARRIISGIQTIHAILDATQNVIRAHHLASSSFPSILSPSSLSPITSIIPCGLAIRLTVAPPETRPRALSPPLGPFSDDVIT